MDSLHKDQVRHSKTATFFTKKMIEDIMYSLENPHSNIAIETKYKIQQMINIGMKEWWW